MSVFFNGRLLVTPSVESAVNDSGLASATPGQAGNDLVLIGTSEGGIPAKTVFYNSPIQARRKLRSGDLLKAVELAFNPSPETGSPARVGVVRVDKAVQSSVTLQDGSANDVIELSSVDYGAHTNGIKVTVEDGSTTGKRVTVQQATEYYTKDNLARTVFTVRYSGAELTATVEVTATELVLRAPDNTGTPVSLTLANYRSVRELCDAINTQPGFSAVAAIPSDAVAGKLDGLAATTCHSTDLAITANLQAIVDWFNTAARELVAATRSTGALAVPANITSGVYLSGGSNGPAPTTDDWQDAFDSLQQEDIRWVVPLSANAAVWAMADAHVAFMSGPGKSERRAFVGGDVVTGDLATAIGTVKDSAISINSDRTAICFPSILEYNDDGVLAAYPAYFLAALVGGGFSAVNPGNTMTNKVINVGGLDPVVANIYDSDTLIDGGVLTARQTSRGHIISKAVSTWLGNDNYNRVEVSTGAALDFVARTVRDALDIFIGRKASPITLHEAVSATDSALRRLARPEPVGPGVIVGDENSPAYRGITASITGDILEVWFECSPVIPINFVLIGIYTKAYSGTATATVNNG